MASVFDLEAILKLNDSSFQQGIENAGKSGVSLAGKLKTTLGTAAKVGAVALAAVGTAAAGATKYILDGAQATAQYGDNIDKMSQKLGMSSTAYQEWDAVLQHSGANIESLQTSMKQLQVAAETGAEAFEQLGISQEQLAEMSPEQMFDATITALQNVTSETERTYLASKLLGRGATELAPLLNTTAEETQAMKDRVHELGGVMSEEAVKASAKYMDTLQDMKTAFSGLTRGLFLEFLPGITNVMAGLTEIFSGNTGSGLAMISDGIHSVVTQMTEQLPEFIEVGMGIVSALGDAIIQNLPEIMAAGGKLLLQLVIGLINAIPQIVKAAPKIISALVSGFKSALPALQAAGMNLIQMIGDGLTAGASYLLEAAHTVWTDLLGGSEETWTAMGESASSAWEGITSTLSGAWEGIQSVASAAGEGLRSFWAENGSAIAETISSVWESITSILGSAWGAIVGLAETIFEGLKSFWATWGGEISSALGEVWNNIVTMFSSALDGIQAVFDMWSAVFAGDWAGAWEAVKAIGTSVWNGIKAALSAAWNSIKAIGTAVFGAIATAITAVWNAIKGVATAVWGDISSALSSVWNSIASTASAVWEGISSTISGVWESIKTGVSTAANDVFTAVSTVFTSVLTTVSSIWNGIKSAISDTMDSIKTTVSNAIDKVKSFFNFEWSLPSIKLPHFSITGQFSLNPPSVPWFTVEWYKKAMQVPYMLSDATIFGAGEAGDEMIYGRQALMEDIQEASGGSNEDLNKKVDIIISVLSQYMPELASRPVVLDGDTLVGALGNPMDMQLGEINTWRGRGLSMA